MSLTIDDTVRLLIPLDSGLINHARDKAAGLGVGLATYINQTVIEGAERKQRLRIPRKVEGPLTTTLYLPQPTMDRINVAASHYKTTPQIAAYAIIAATLEYRS